jgi:hypothetical protein
MRWNATVRAVERTDNTGLSSGPGDARKTVGNRCYEK